MAASFMPGAVVADVARQSTSRIYKWRKACLASASPPAFAPANLIELLGGTRLTVAANAPASLVAATLKALRP